MISYNLAPIPMWVLRDNLGEPLENGYMLAYRDTVRSEFKAVYSNIAGTSVYLQPIVFNAAGFQGPFYWASDENYYLEIYDFNNNLIKTIPNYNAPAGGGNTPVTNNIDFFNYIVDPQFDFPRKITFSPVGIQEEVGSSNWVFLKNNTSATDTIKILTFDPGTSVPPNNPKAYFQYECTVPGATESEKELIYYFSDVRSFQNRTMTIAFWGMSPSTANTVEVVFIQKFGTGGSAQVDMHVTTFTLTSSWAQYHISGTPPSITGKVIGMDGNVFPTDNPTLLIAFRLPLNAATQINLTNFQINDGAQLLDFNYITRTNATPAQIPYLDTTTTANACPTISDDGYMHWSSAIPVGSIVAYGLDGTAPPGWNFCDGAALSATAYPYLFNVIGYKYGGAGDTFNLPSSTIFSPFGTIIKLF